jgi:hypothetical protein
MRAALELAEKAAGDLTLFGSITGRPDRARVNEEHFTRLCTVPRATRQQWATDGLLDRQRSPYTLRELQEVLAVKVLREVLASSKSASVVWTQLRKGFPSACRAGRFVLVVDRYLLRSTWVTDNEVVLDAARSGHVIQLIDLADALAEAEEGFQLAARMAAGASSSA